MELVSAMCIPIIRPAPIGIANGHTFFFRVSRIGCERDGHELLSAHGVGALRGVMLGGVMAVQAGHECRSFSLVSFVLDGVEEGACA